MQNSLVITLFFVVVGLLSFSQSEAQLPDTLELNIFEYQESQADPLPGVKTSQVDSQSMARQSHQNLGDLINTQTPVFVKSYGLGGLSTPSFRGTGASHTQIAWNGIPVNSPMNGLSDLNLYPVALMEGLTLTHGSGGMASRPGGMGGRINLENRTSWSNGVNAGLRQSIGSFGNQQTFSELGIGNDQWQSQTKIYYRSADNDYPYTNLAEAGEPREREDNAAYVQYGLMQEVYFKPSEKDYLTAHVWFQETDRELPTPVNVSERNQEQFDQHIRSVVKWRHYWQGGGLKVKSGFLQQDLEFRDPSVDILSEHQAWSSLNEVSVRQKIGTVGLLNTGFTYDHHWAESDGYADIKQQDQLSWYGRYQHHFSDNLEAFGRFQQELVNGKRAPFLPTLGITFKPLAKNRLALHGKISRNYKVPSLNDLYWENGGNPDLKPESGWSQDLGVSYELENPSDLLNQFKLEGTVYRGLYDNWILWAPNKTGTWEAENIQKVLTRGIETSFESRWDLGSFNLSLDGQYSYTQSKNLKSTQNLDASMGKQLIYVPFHQANVNTTFHLKGYRLSYQYEYTGKRYISRDHGKSLNKYMLSHAGISKGFKVGRFGISGQIRVENLLDTYYESMAWRPMPGRSFHLKINLTYANQ